MSPDDSGNGVLLRLCGECRLEKAPNDFYKKGSRLESRCKACLKRKRINDYNRKKKLPDVPSKRRVTSVVIKGVQTMSADQYKREMEAVELILENLIYRVLSKKLQRGLNE